MSGKIWLHRRLLHGYIWSLSANHRVVFIHLLLTVNWEDGIWVTDEGERLSVGAGERVVGLRRLAGECAVSLGTLRRALEVLAAGETIAVKADRRWTRITVRNWSEYQAVSDEGRIEDGIADGIEDGIADGIANGPQYKTKDERRKTRESRTLSLPGLEGEPIGAPDSSSPPHPPAVEPGTAQTGVPGQKNPNSAVSGVLAEAPPALGGGKRKKRANPPASPKNIQTTPGYTAFVASFTELFSRVRGGARPAWGERQGFHVKQVLGWAGSVEAAMARAERMFEMAPRWPAENPDLATLVGHWDKFAPPVRDAGRGYAAPTPHADFESGEEQL